MRLTSCRPIHPSCSEETVRQLTNHVRTSVPLRVSSSHPVIRELPSHRKPAHIDVAGGSPDEKRTVAIVPGHTTGTPLFRPRGNGAPGTMSRKDCVMTKRGLEKRAPSKRTAFLASLRSLPSLWPHSRKEKGIGPVKKKEKKALVLLTSPAHRTSAHVLHEPLTCIITRLTPPPQSLRPSRLIITPVI